MSTAADQAASMAQLYEERDFLLGSLEDLEREREAGDLDEADYRSLRDSYTGRAAAVLRAIEAAGASTAADPLPPVPHGDPGQAAGGPAQSSNDVEVAEPGGATPRRRTWIRRWLRPALTSAAVLAMAVLAGSLVADSSGERLPGEAASGSLTPTGPSSGLERARLLIGEGKTLEAIKAYDEVLRRDPRQPEALAYRGWLLRLAGRAGGNRSLLDSGMAFVDRAVAADPTYPDAHFFRGMMLYQDRGDAAGAVAEFRAFLENDPPEAMVPVVEDALRRALATVQGGGQPAPPAPAPPAPR